MGDERVSVKGPRTTPWRGGASALIPIPANPQGDGRLARPPMCGDGRHLVIKAHVSKSPLTPRSASGFAITEHRETVITLGLRQPGQSATSA